MTIHPDLGIELREPPRGKLSFDKFLKWCNQEEGTRAEWIDGEVIVLLPDSSRDQRVIQLLIMLLRHWIDAGDLGTLFQENFLMRLRQPQRRGRVPDLLLVSRQHADRIRPTYLDGPGNVAVEVISPDSGQRDRIDKFREYELAGVPEYWLIDPLREWGEFYELDAAGRFQLALAGRTGRYTSRALTGFWIELEWLWQDPPPKIIDLLRQLGLL